jgi:hypothetical protein
MVAWGCTGSARARERDTTFVAAVHMGAAPHTTHGHRQERLKTHIPKEPQYKQSLIQNPVCRWTSFESSCAGCRQTDLPFLRRVAGVRRAICETSPIQPGDLRQAWDTTFDVVAGVDSP